MNQRYLLAAALAVAGAFPPVASAASLNVGDPAPKLQTGKIVQGDPISEFVPRHGVHCRVLGRLVRAMQGILPHLNKTCSKFKDKGLIVIEQDCLEKDPFLKSMGEKKTHRVALDDKQGSEKGKMSDI